MNLNLEQYEELRQQNYDLGFLAGLKYARDWCKSNETYIQEAIDELEEYDDE